MYKKGFNLILIARNETLLSEFREILYQIPIETSESNRNNEKSIIIIATDLSKRENSKLIYQKLTKLGIINKVSKFISMKYIQ